MCTKHRNMALSMHFTTKEELVDPKRMWRDMKYELLPKLSQRPIICKRREAGVFPVREAARLAGVVNVRANSWYMA